MAMCSDRLSAPAVAQLTPVLPCTHKHLLISPVCLGHQLYTPSLRPLGASYLPLVMCGIGMTVGQVGWPWVWSLDWGLKEPCLQFSGRDLSTDVGLFALGPAFLVACWSLDTWQKFVLTLILLLKSEVVFTAVVQAPRDNSLGYPLKPADVT